MKLGHFCIYNANRNISLLFALYLEVLLLLFSQCNYLAAMRSASKQIADLYLSCVVFISLRLQIPGPRAFEAKSIPFCVLPVNSLVG